MTNIIHYPFAPAKKPYNVARLQAHLRRLKPYTPEIRIALTRVFDRHEEFALACEQYFRNASLTGVSDRSRIDKILPEFTEARHDALIAIGADPDSTDLLPAVPEFLLDS